MNRREFLKLLGVGVAASLAPGVVISEAFKIDTHPGWKIEFDYELFDYERQIGVAVMVFGDKDLPVFMKAYRQVNKNGWRSLTEKERHDRIKFIQNALWDELPQEYKKLPVTSYGRIGG